MAENQNDLSSLEAKIEKVTVDIEKIKAFLDTLKEERKVYMERFSQINESIGDLRRTLIEREKQINELEAKVLKTLDIVSEVDPEGFVVSLKKEDAKIDAVRARTEGLEEMIKELTKEIRDIREKMSLFRGTEHILKLMDEIRDVYKKIQKMNANVERRSDKVEGLFLEIQKLIPKIREVDDKVSDLDKNQKQLFKEVDKLRAAMNSVPNKSELLDFEKKINEKLKEFDKIVSASANAPEIIKKLSLAYEEVSRAKDQLEQRINEKLKEIDDIIRMRDVLLDNISKLENRYDSVKKMLDSLISLREDIVSLLEQDKLILEEIIKKERESKKKELIKTGIERLVENTIRKKKIKLSEKEVDELRKLLVSRIKKSIEKTL